MDIGERDSVRLQAFSAMAKDIALSRTLSETVERVMHHVGQVFNPHTWSLLLRDVKTGQLKFVYASGPGSGALEGLVLDRGQGVAGWVADHGEALLVADAAQDPRFSPKVDEKTGQLTRSIIAVPLGARGRVYGVIELINRLDDGDFSARDLVVLQTIGDFAAVAIERAYFLKRARRLALTDPLTGLANRREFLRVLDHETEKTRRTSALFSVLYLDIDKFKAINDRHGHAAGDEVLRALGRILLATARKVDTAARLGGDEFALLLPDTGAENLPFVERRLQRAVDDYSQTAPAPFTVSIGSQIVDPQHPELVLEEADKALYRAKARQEAAEPLEGSLGPWLDDDHVDFPPTAP